MIWNLSVWPWIPQSLGPSPQSCIPLQPPDCGALCHLRKRFRNIKSRLYQKYDICLKKRRYKKHVNESFVVRSKSDTELQSLCWVSHAALTTAIKVKWRTGESRLNVSGNRTTNWRSFPHWQKDWTSAALKGWLCSLPRFRRRTPRIP